ncbi:unnamed protein product [Sphacelaria rigidula]
MIKSENDSERPEESCEKTGFSRDPFSYRPQEAKRVMMRQTKRSQRYRSTARSRICGMTVGDIRYCFQQLRSAGSALSPHLILYNGQCAGEFALSYLIETSNSMRKRRKKKRQEESEPDDVGLGVDKNTFILPDSQLPSERSPNDQRSKYLLEFS